MRNVMQWIVFGICALCGAWPGVAAGDVMPETPSVVVLQDVGMAPVRPLAEIYGLTLEINGKIITVTRGAQRITMVVDSAAALQDGKKLTLPLAPFAHAGVIYVPVRALVTALGGEIALPAPKILRVTFPATPPLDLPLVSQAGTLADFKQRSCGNLYLVDTEGGPVRQLTYETGANGMDFGARTAIFSPDGMSILYEKSFNIVRRPLDSPTSVNLTAAFGQERIMSMMPVSCPDGSLLFMQLDRKGQGAEAQYPDVCRMNADGTGYQIVAKKAAFPLVSRDGSVIAYSTIGEQDAAIMHVMTADGTEERTLGAGQAYLLSPDGSTLFYRPMETRQQRVRGATVTTYQADYLAAIKTGDDRALFADDHLPIVEKCFALLRLQSEWDDAGVCETG